MYESRTCDCCGVGIGIFEPYYTSSVVLTDMSAARIYTTTDRIYCSIKCLQDDRDVFCKRVDNKFGTKPIHDTGRFRGIVDMLFKRFSPKVL